MQTRSRTQAAQSTSAHAGPEQALEVGDYVRIRPSVETPRLGLQRWTRNTIGRISEVSSETGWVRAQTIREIDFSWAAYPSDLERVQAVRALRVGDMVRVRRHIVRPRFGWGDIDHDRIGTLLSVDHNTHEPAFRVTATVSFPGDAVPRAYPWNARVEELELALGPDVPEDHAQHTELTTRVRPCGPRPAPEPQPPHPNDDDSDDDDSVPPPEILRSPLVAAMAGAYARQLKRKREDAVQAFTDFVDGLQEKGQVDEQTWKTLLELGMKLYQPGE